MSTAPVRNLLFGALLLIAAWVPAAMVSAPGSAHSAVQHVPEVGRATQVRSTHPVAPADCRALPLEQRS